MALLSIDHFSECLNLSHSCTVILPQQTRGQIGMAGATVSQDRYPTLWLLHGRTDDHSIWLRRTSIERYVAPLGIAVVMPAVHLSRYANMVHGQRYWDYVSEELPELLERWLPIANSREQRYVAGLSMGGWGTFKLALNRPERFAAAASLSGSLMSVAALKAQMNDPDRTREMATVFGDGSGLEGSADDLLFQGGLRAAAGIEFPRLYACCGTEDFLLDHNRRMIPALRELGLPITYEEGPGSHDWHFWDNWIQRVLNWMGFDIAAPDLGVMAR